MSKETRGEILLDAIYDEIDQALNPDQEDCWYCNGEGYTYDCIDGCCIDAESGCEDCARPCMECMIYKRKRNRAIREEVIKSDDVDIARAWLKSIGRWRDDITDEQIRTQLAAEREKLLTAAIPAPDSEEGT